MRRPKRVESVAFAESDPSSGGSAWPWMYSARRRAYSHAHRVSCRWLVRRNKDLHRATQNLGGGDLCACRVQGEPAHICVSVRFSCMLRTSAPPIFLSKIGKRLARRFPISPYNPARQTEYQQCVREFTLARACHRSVLGAIDSRRPWRTNMSTHLMLRSFFQRRTRQG